jgi:hypothetical protein
MAILNQQCLGFVTGFMVATMMDVAADTSFNFSGNQLLHACRSAYGFCVGYVTGIAQAMAEDPKGVLGFRACFRLNQTNVQFADAVVLWLQDHPEKRDSNAASLTAQALTNAFPCP